jgi:hypothetical protein
MASKFKFPSLTHFKTQQFLVFQQREKEYEDNGHPTAIQLAVITYYLRILSPMIIRLMKSESTLFSRKFSSMKSFNENEEWHSIFFPIRKYILGT